MEKLTVDVVQDIACPWCRIGQANLQEAISRWNGPEVEVRYHPYMLNPALPSSGADFRTYLSQKFGTDDLKPMFDRVSDAARQAGLMCDWDKVSKAPNTLNVHRLIAMTPPERQSDLVRDLYKAYFQDGLDVGDSPTLAMVAARHGWDESEALRRLESDELAEETKLAASAAASGGITGVPFFVFDNNVALSGAQSADVMLAAMKQAAEAPAPVS